MSALLAAGFAGPGERRVAAADSGPIPPSINVSEAVGGDPGTVYTAAHTQRTVSVAWNAGSDYPYCEIYYTVNNSNQTELGREHDGVKPLTITAGSTYVFWMVVYLGAQGQDVRTAARLTVIGKQGDQPSSSPPPAAGSVGVGRMGKDKAGPGRELLDRRPFISDVRVRPDNRDVIISFTSTQTAPPLIEIAKVPPAPDRFGIIAFPFNSGAITRFVPGANGKYSLDLGTLNEKLDIGEKYYYIINVFNDDKNDTRRPREQKSGVFTTRPQSVTVVFEKVLVADDSDDLSPGEITWWFWVNFGQPSQWRSINYFRGDMDSGHYYDLNMTAFIANAPDQLSLAGSGSDNDLLAGSILHTDEEPPMNGPEDNPYKDGTDANGAKGEFDLTKYPGKNVTVPFQLNSPDGKLRFAIFGHFDIDRDPENIGTVRTALAPTPPPTKSLGRVSVGTNDFNDDGRGDILWHNAATGESQIWFISGTSRIGRATVIGENGKPALVGLPWSNVGSKDFNVDGKTDLLWYNSSTGETQIWNMNGSHVTSRATVLGENGSAALVGLPWTIVGTGDMNGDKNADIIWHNSQTGETQIWQMSGYKVTGRATVVGENGSAALVGLPWSMVGSGDFNRDGKPDLLWHNSSTGETQVWQMNGYKVTSRATVMGENGNAAFVGPPWSIVGTNDFNEDGSADILWHNESTGETQIWLMNGFRVSGRRTLLGEDGKAAAVGAPWSIVNH